MPSNFRMGQRVIYKKDEDWYVYAIERHPDYVYIHRANDTWGSNLVRMTDVQANIRLKPYLPVPEKESYDHIAVSEPQVPADRPVRPYRSSECPPLPEPVLGAVAGSGGDVRNLRSSERRPEEGHVRDQVVEQFRNETTVTVPIIPSSWSDYFWRTADEPTTYFGHGLSEVL